MQDVDMQNEIKFTARGVDVRYGDAHAIKSVDIDIEDRAVTAFIGPSGCGKVDLPALSEPDERHHRHL